MSGVSLPQQQQQQDRSPRGADQQQQQHHDPLRDERPHAPTFNHAVSTEQQPQQQQQQQQSRYHNPHRITRPNPQFERRCDGTLSYDDFGAKHRHADATWYSLSRCYLPYCAAPSSRANTTSGGGENPCSPHDLAVTSATEDEVQCPWRVPAPPVNSDSSYCSSGDDECEFERHTRWMFDKWYPWRRHTTRGLHETTGGHRADGLYELRNVCVDPRGQLYGSSNRRVDAYRGQSDIYPVTPKVGPDMGSFASWISNVQTTKEDVVVQENTVVVFPIMDRMDNPGHGFYRTGSLLRVIEAVKQRSSGNVTVMFVVVDGSPFMWTARRNAEMNAMRLYYDMLHPHTWFSVMGPSMWSRVGQDRDELRRFFGFWPDDAAMAAPMCFRSMVMWQDSHGDLVGVQDGASEEIGHQTMFHIHGTRAPRDAETLALLYTALWRCLHPVGGDTRADDQPLSASSTSGSFDGAVGPRRNVTRLAFSSSPHVVFITRSVERRLIQQPFMISAVREFVDTVWPGGRLHVVEMAYLSMADIVRVFSDADVVIGHYGAGLVWTMFMPPGGVFVEINYKYGQFSRGAGINRPENQQSEYGGGAIVGRLVQMVLPDLRENSLRLTWDYHDNAMSVEHVVFGLERIECLRRNGMFASVLSSADPFGFWRPEAVPAECQFGDAEVLRLLDNQLSDADGRHTLRALEVSASKSPRLHLLKRHAAAFNERVVLPFRASASVDVLFVLSSCASDVPQDVLLEEVSALRMLIPAVKNVWVADALCGGSTCAGLADSGRLSRLHIEHCGCPCNRAVDLVWKNARSNGLASEGGDGAKSVVFSSTDTVTF
eukprot:PhM_4_TR15654/c2_g1_i1/m.61311